MSSNPLSKLLKPRFPDTAVGIEGDATSVVQLDRARGEFMVKRAASIRLSDDVVQPSFDRPNLDDRVELARALTDLVTSAGLLRQRKWSVSLPEGTTRSAIIAIESTGGSRHETEELFEWKIERSFGAPAAELRVSREQLPRDQQGQARYLVTAVRLDVLAEYELVFAALGWHAGLILPRHTGEEQWLHNGHQADGLLLSGHREGFTAVLIRGNRPLTLRSVLCDASESDDELHRVLLFYRERASAASSNVPAPIDRLLVIGGQLNKRRVSEIAADALGVSLRPLDAADVGLLIPAGELDFDTIAAPAGLARLAW